MISYKWLDNCCNRRELLDLEDYKIVGKTKAAAVRKAFRHDFTAADDRILIEFLKEQGLKGNIALSGNKIYEALAAKVPIVLDKS